MNEPAGRAEHAAIVVNEEWLAKRPEAALDPDLPIVDVHHHLWDRAGRYMLEELLADTNSGHKIVATVFVQCHSMYKADGPEELKPVGETEFVNGVAAMSASGKYGPCRVAAGIIGYGDLTVGDKVKPMLEAHIRAGGGRFKGVRGTSSWDEDDALWPGPARSIPKLLTDPKFHAGFAHLSKLGLLFEPSVFHRQIPEVTALARKFPDTSIVVNHIGGLLTRGAYATKTEETYAVWRANMKELATCPNVTVKLGGLARRTPGITFNKLDTPPSSEDLAQRWKRYIDACVEDFGAARCMFESNFPVDKSCYSYAVVWNAFKRATSGYSAADRTALFSGTAKRVYRLENV